LTPTILMASQKPHRWANGSNMGLHLSGKPDIGADMPVGPLLTRCGSGVGQNAVMHNTAFPRIW
jgi:hypothetical protein